VLGEHFLDLGSRVPALKDLVTNDSHAALQRSRMLLHDLLDLDLQTFDEP
jgi:hypothetical protein